MSPLFALLILVACVVTWVHWPALSAKAISFDDNQYLVDNPLVQTPSRASAGRFLKEVLSPSTVGGYYQPLAMISLMLDDAMGGRPNNLRPFHRTSLALHVINTALVIVLLYMLFGDPWIAAMVGLLFGVHPLTVEPIPWVGERKTLLAAFFALLALIAYVRYVHCGLRTENGETKRGESNPQFAIRNPQSQFKAWYGLSVVCYVLALLSKPTSTPLPVLMLLLDYWPLRRLSRRTVVEKVPFFVIGLVSAVITFLSQQEAGGVYYPGEKSPLRVPFILCHNIVFYLYKMVLPVKLSSHYPFPEPMTLSQPMILVGVIGTCILIPLLLISLRWTRVLLTGWLFFFVAIFPTLGVIGFTIAIASDKYAYLPSFGILMILAFLLGRVRSLPFFQARFWAPSLVIIGLPVLLASLEAVGTRSYLADWQDSQKLYAHMLALAPDASLLRYNYGLVLVEQGRTEDAIAQYGLALVRNPKYVEAHNNLGLALARQGRIDEAIVHYRKALELKPDQAGVYNNLGTALAAAGRNDEAVVAYQRVLALKSDYAEAYSNLGNVLAAQGRADEAIVHLRKAIELKPNETRVHYNLGNVFAVQGKADEAIQEYRKVLQLNPNYIEARNNLGNVLSARGRTDEAIAEYRRVLQLNPDSAEAHINLGAALAEQGRLDEAIHQYGEGLRIRPQDANTHCDLGMELQKAGRMDEAIREYREAIRINPQHETARNQLQAARLQTANTSTSPK